MDVRFLFVVGYLLLMVGVSLYLKRKMVKSSDDFAVAGRRLPMIVLVGTLLLHGAAAAVFRVPQAWFIKTDLCLVSCCLQELRSE